MTSKWTHVQVLQKVKSGLIVADEAHTIKSASGVYCSLLRALDTASILAMSGTPFINWIQDIEGVSELFGSAGDLPPVKRFTDKPENTAAVFDPDFDPYSTLDCLDPIIYLQRPGRHHTKSEGTRAGVSGG